LGLTTSNHYPFQIEIVIIRRDLCLRLPRDVCVDKGAKVFTADNVPKDLIAHWTFDDRFAHDYSGNENDLEPIPEVGPQAGE
jgi:hypothetical protein